MEKYTYVVKKQLELTIGRQGICVKKKLVILNTTLMLGLGSAFSSPSIEAKTLNNQKVDIQNQRSSIQSSISKAEQQLNAVLEELAKLNAQIKRVDQAVIDNNKLMSKTEKDIKNTNDEVEKLKTEITIIQERIDKRTEILKQRAQVFQENNTSIGYIEVLLGATSFRDFIERVGAVTQIVEADQEIIKQHDADKKELEEKQQTVEKKLADLQDLKAELEEMRTVMDEQKKQNDELKKQLEGKRQELASLNNELKMKDSTLAAKEREIQNRIEQSLKAPQGENSIPVSGGGSSSSGSNSSAQTPSNGNNVSSPSATINKIINAGYKYIGNSVYVFGGGRTEYDIANGRFDCSGYVAWAFAQGGVKLPASTSGLRTKGTKVSYSNAKPGDLVFFDTYKKDGHVGIYMGGGKFIGSQNSTGVAIANMNSGYWKNHFNGHVRRIIN